VIDPNLIKGILSIAAGKNYSIEGIAEELNVNEDLLDTCLRLSSVARKEKKIQQVLTDLKRISSFTRFCRHLKMDPNIVGALLRLSFNKVNYDEFPEIMTTLRLNVTSLFL
jgi:hypothetical protein